MRPPPPIALPVLSPDGLTFTPTDVTEFVRLEQCERFLRLRLAERAGQMVMEEYGVSRQPIPPLLSLSGRLFEEGVFATVERRHRTVRFSREEEDHNRQVVETIRTLPPGEVLVLVQPRVTADVNGWRVRGEPDLVRVERGADGTLDLLVADVKASDAVKVEHRLQCAFYRLVLETLLAGRVAHAPIRLGVLHRPPVADGDVPPPPNTSSQNAHDLFGLGGAHLQVVDDPDPYLRSAHDLVLGGDSVAVRVAMAEFADVPYALSFKCDGCPYTEFCMKWSADVEDISLLPYTSGPVKDALNRAGVHTVTELAALKRVAGEGGELVTADGRADLVKELARTWAVGPQLDELIYRAKSFRHHLRGDSESAPEDLPGAGPSTLPASTPDQNPNLVCVYLDAQHDYREGRVYLLGGLVVAHRNGAPAERRAVVRMTDEPPTTAEVERRLLVDWTRALAEAVVEVAVSGGLPGEPKAAPLHVVFFDRYRRQTLLDALARNFTPVLAATPPLYDFLTQVAAFDTPPDSYLDEELRAAKNLPMTCQSLQSVAKFLGFDWNTPHPFRQLFRDRVFDYLGRRGAGGRGEWFTKRARFNSGLPLEYAYAAWGDLSPATTDDPFAGFRSATRELLTAFARRRLEALEHVAGSVRANTGIEKTPFTLPDLTRYSDRAADLAHALHEFVTLERLADLQGWLAARHPRPALRALAGECLIVRYVEADQEPSVAEANRENRRRWAARGEGGGAQRERLNVEGLRVTLRVDVSGCEIGIVDALALGSLKPGDWVVLSPRSAPGRSRPGSVTHPTARQLLYAQRGRLADLRTVRECGVETAIVTVELGQGFAPQAMRPFAFPGFSRPLADGVAYTIDPCPDDVYGYWMSQVVDGLCRGEPNVLYRRLTAPAAEGTPGLPGQVEFLAGLDAFHAAGLLHPFEEAKRDLIAGHGKTPVLLVQRPPGTGKSYAAAFAVFARLQGAMRAGLPLRAFLTCKTHAATDVLVNTALKVQQDLRRLRVAEPALFDRHFDRRLLEVPVYRIAPAGEPPAAAVHLPREGDRRAGDQFAVDRVREAVWTVSGVTPGGTFQMLKGKWPNAYFGQGVCDLLVLDEASQLTLPEALAAALPLKPHGRIVVVGDHRQLPPVVKHDWDAEARRTFQQYQAYQSLFDTLRLQDPPPPMIQFAESFRLHGAMAEFLRREVYRHDGIEYHSRKTELLAAIPHADEFTAAVLAPEYPLVVVVHDEAASQVRNPFEQNLIGPILRTLVDKAKYGLDPAEGLGVVVPHRAQRAALQQAFPELSVLDPATGLPSRSAIDTVERFQGGERTVILVSATESDPAYLLTAGEFLLDPRRLTVALSRAKRKMILVASRSVFSLFSPHEETFANSQLWKTLLATCSIPLWAGDHEGVPVTVWGCGHPCRGVLHCHSFP